MTKGQRAGLIFFLVGVVGFYSGNPSYEIVFIVVEFLGAVGLMQEYI